MDTAHAADMSFVSLPPSSCLETRYCPDTFPDTFQSLFPASVFFKLSWIWPSLRAQPPAFPGHVPTVPAHLLRHAPCWHTHKAIGHAL